MSTPGLRSRSGNPQLPETDQGEGKLFTVGAFELRRNHVDALLEARYLFTDRTGLGPGCIDLLPHRAGLGPGRVELLGQNPLTGLDGRQLLGDLQQAGYELRKVPALLLGKFEMLHSGLEIRQSYRQFACFAGCLFPRCHGARRHFLVGGFQAVQALLDRRQPGLPFLPQRLELVGHGGVRPGVSTSSVESARGAAAASVASVDVADSVPAVAGTVLSAPAVSVPDCPVIQDGSPRLRSMSPRSAPTTARTGATPPRQEE